MQGSMPTMPVVVGIDGHDGTGKTTIARNVATQLGFSYQRPFSGDHGLALARASASGDTEEVLRIGVLALTRAMQAARDSKPVILDRSWMTVASLVDDTVFHERWTLWIPTILCWADLPTTLERLAQRDEPEESTALHRHYIERYHSIAMRAGCTIVDTSNETEETSTAKTALLVLELNSVGHR